jgi:hypothetical protein
MAGVPQLVRTCLMLEQSLGLETLDICKGDDDISTVAQLAGRQILFVIALRGESEVWLFGQGMDTVEEPVTLLRVLDDLFGWILVEKVISGLETQQVESLALPIEIGPINEEGLVIG